MTRRSVRVTLVCLGILLTTALGHRIFIDEQTLTTERQRLTFIDTTTDEVLRSLSDMRGVLHAYVAPGQSSDVWEARSAALFDKLRQQLIALDAAADTAGGSLTESLDNLDQLKGADKRVRHYLDFSQPLLASDVIFNEIRDLIEATGQQVNSVRDTLRRDVNGRIDLARREQAVVVASGTAFWVALGILLALVPKSKKRQADAATASSPEAAGESFDLSLTPREEATKVPDTPTQQVQPPPPAPIPAGVEVAAVVENPEMVLWKSVTNICTELSSVKELSSLPAPLSRACDALGARDAVVWVASVDGETLTAQASHGFDTRVLARIGAIPRDSANLTAAAFRDGKPHRSHATASSPGALAVALKGPAGSVGVLSAELEPQSDLAAAVDLATIFAAQITPLVMQSQLAPAEVPERRQA